MAEELQLVDKIVSRKGTFITALDFPRVSVPNPAHTGVIVYEVTAARPIFALTPWAIKTTTVNFAQIQ